MGTIIGREMEMHTLAECMQSPRSELIAVYGRRRIGTRYGTQLTLITTFGVLKNKHYSVVDSEVTLDDLF